MSNTNQRTIAETTIALSGLAPIEAAAAKNGMTTNQMAAAQYIGPLASKLSAETKAILGSKDTGLAALARIAGVPMLDETTEARIARIQAAILD